MQISKVCFGDVLLVTRHWSLVTASVGGWRGASRQRANSNRNEALVSDRGRFTVTKKRFDFRSPS